MMIRVLLADDQPLIRASLQAVITDAPGLEVAAEAGNGAQAVQLARKTHPDVIVMDIRMPGMDGIEATRRIMADTPDAHVLVLTTFDDDEYIYGRCAPEPRDSSSKTWPWTTSSPPSTSSPPETPSSPPASPAA